MAENEDELQRSLHKLNIVAKELQYGNIRGKTKVMAFLEKEPIRSKIVLEGKPIVHASEFKYLGYSITKR